MWPENGQFQTEQVSYFSRVETAEAFSRSALVEWHRRGGKNAYTVFTANNFLSGRGLLKVGTQW